MRFAVIILLLFLSISVVSQRYTISGYIKDKQTGEELIGANLIVDGTGYGATTNTYGFYTLTLPEGTYNIRFTYIGYKDLEKSLKLNKNISINAELESSAFLTDEVVIIGQQNRHVEDSRMSIIRIPVEEIKTLPAFMGEVDVLKTIQLLPGVQGAGEGESGFYVRGGGPDQNLVLLDEAVVYNANHLFGFFSVFNADAINDIEIYTGGMPAEYGGRISSVLNITMNNGNMREFKAQGGIGTIASRITAEGPIKKDTSSFLISARRTYIDLLIKPFTKKDSPFRGSGYYFYDLNAKFNYKFSDKDRIFLSGYYGKDIFNFKAGSGAFKMSIPWGNGMGSLRWNRLINSRFFLNTTLVLSDYRFQTDVQMGEDDSDDAFRFIQSSGIRDYYIKQDYTWFPSPQHTIKFGWNYIYHIFTPNSLEASIGATEYDFTQGIDQYAHEAAVYIGDDYKINDIITVYGGLRASMFNQVGPFTRYVKDEYRLVTVDTIVYENNESVALYNSLEPRASIKVSTGKKSSVKASFMQNKQYIHLASMSASTLPTDLWVPSSDVVKPQQGRQYAVGYFRNFMNNHFESSVEVYYKDMFNLIEYVDGAVPGDDVNDNSDNYFTFGDGNSYGIEFFLRKTTGNLTGWIGYTLAKTTRFFDEVNNGEPFPAKYDRRHDLSFTATYSITEKLTASMVFVYATGNTTTLPASRYMIDGLLVDEYSERNSYRMEPYHRLDLSITYLRRKTQKWESSWNFSIYNVYNRKNPFFIYFEDEGKVQDGDFVSRAKQVSLIPFMPSVTWNFKF